MKISNSRVSSLNCILSRVEISNSSVSFLESDRSLFSPSPSLTISIFKVWINACDSFHDSTSLLLLQAYNLRNKSRVSGSQSHLFRCIAAPHIHSANRQSTIAGNGNDRLLRLLSRFLLQFQIRLLLLVVVYNFKVDFCDMESDSSSDHDEVSKQRGPTIKSKTKKGKSIITYNKKGVPIGEEAKKLSTFEGMAARTMMHFVVDLKSRKNSLKSVGSKWRNFKHYLFKKFIEKYKNDPKPKFPRPETYPFIEKADWKLFVAQRLSKKWQKKSDYAKKAWINRKPGTNLKGYPSTVTFFIRPTCCALVYDY
ncbi:hypothetical protein LXL04_006818 [Taraxacum kok-saghyz]